MSKIISPKDIYKQILGEKKVEIIEFLCKNADKNSLVITTIDEICTALDVSKPTVIDTFNILKDKNILKRIKNGVYRLEI